MITLYILLIRNGVPYFTQSFIKIIILMCQDNLGLEESYFLSLFYVNLEECIAPTVITCNFQNYIRKMFKGFSQIAFG